MQRDSNLIVCCVGAWMDWIVSVLFCFIFADYVDFPMCKLCITLWFRCIISLFDCSAAIAVLRCVCSFVSECIVIGIWLDSELEIDDDLESSGGNGMVGIDSSFIIICCELICQHDGDIE